MVRYCVPKRCWYLQVKSPPILHRRVVLMNIALSDLMKPDSRFRNVYSSVSMFGESEKVE